MRLYHQKKQLFQIEWTESDMFLFQRRKGNIQSLSALCFKAQGKKKEKLIKNYDFHNKKSIYRQQLFLPFQNLIRKGGERTFSPQLYSIQYLSFFSSFSIVPFHDLIFFIHNISPLPLLIRLFGKSCPMVFKNLYLYIKAVLWQMVIIISQRYHDTCNKKGL